MTDYGGRIVHVDAFISQIKERSDKLMNYFLVAYFLVGLLLAFFYDTWFIAIGVGGLSLLAYYTTKLLVTDSNLYQYVLSTVFGIFMAQYIYQMHGLFEMHFIAFVGSTILVTYQNWKLQVPIALVVIVHHALFGYLQYIGYDKIYFTQLDYMTLQTFIIHGILATIIFFICGLWAYHFKKYSESHIEQTFEMGRLQEDKLQKEELERTNTELIKSNKELDRFVYSVSHDLRAPLSSMLGVIGISETVTDDPFMIKNMSMLKLSITKLDGFIKDILDYSRNSRTEIGKEEIHFNDLLHDITNNLKHMCANEKKQIDIRTSIKNGIPFHSDKSRITIILSNLISNAMRYHHPDVADPFIEIGVAVSENAAAIVIKDNGIGIDKMHQEKIFEMFYRVSTKSVGSGLGLYIVKETMEKLGGTIRLTSEPGKGTEFNLIIPNLVA
ncbi:MAG: arcB 3 [Flavipsychrobacter sp.]|nr:arcB 3 [Flavipsychrobacter sp.]